MWPRYKGVLVIVPLETVPCSAFASVASSFLGDRAEEEFSSVAQNAEAKEVIWLPPRDSNPDMLIQSQLSCR